MANNETKKKKKKKGNKSVAVLTVLLIILAILLAIVFILTRSKPEEKVDPNFDITVDDPEEEDETVGDDAHTIDHERVTETLEADEEIVITKDEGWTHYLLLGVDGETNSYSSKRSDAMIVLSINDTEGRVVLSSVPRDTLVYIEGKGFDKLTHAYAYGGADLTVQAYEDNFDIDIENYFTINFAVMREMVDTLGGLQLTITDAEAKHMGDYYGAWGLKGGTQILNGKEVLAYCRVRKIDSDYKRTERQFKVLKAIYEEVKNASLSEYTKLIGDIYPNIYTDMIMMDCISLAGKILGILDSGELENVKLVDSDHSRTGSLNGKSVVLVDNLVDTATRWREALGIENYTPSKRIQQISDQLESLK